MNSSAGGVDEGIGIMLNYRLLCLFWYFLGVDGHLMPE